MNESADKIKWLAVQERNKQWDGKFVYAVTTTRVYCRPACPARAPKRQNVRFFAGPTEARQAGFRACRRCKPDQSKTVAREVIDQAQKFIQENLDRSVTLKELADHVGLSQFHFQRLFKAETGISPKQYSDEQRLQLFKREARSSRSLTDAIFDAGYGSSSRIYSRAAKSLGMTPSAYRKQGCGQTIDWSFADCPLGSYLIAATEKGLCFLQFGTDKRALASALQSEFSEAQLRENASALAQWVDAVSDYLNKPQAPLAAPIDVAGTEFQMKVWQYLRKIPAGQTRTYSEVAQAIGRPSAVRAVANACAANRMAMVIPCHRVVRENGGLGGYRWGITRKQALLQHEKSNG